jgi:hypothetical protein
LEVFLAFLGLKYPLLRKNKALEAVLGDVFTVCVIIFRLIIYPNRWGCKLFLLQLVLLFTKEFQYLIPIRLTEWLIVVGSF